MTHYEKLVISGNCIEECMVEEKFGRRLYYIDNKLFYQESEQGDKWWYDAQGRFHRDYFPAVEYVNGGKFFYEHGVMVLHKTL